MLSIFNYSVKKLWNLESRFSNSDTSWKNNTSIILVETLRMVIYLSKYLLKTHFSLFEIKKKWFLSEKKQGQGKGSCLTLKSLAKLSPRMQKLYHITHIFCNTLWSVFVQSSDTNLMAPRGALGLQCICRAQLIIQTTHLHCRSPLNYVTGLLAYCRG